MTNSKLRKCYIKFQQNAVGKAHEACVAVYNGIMPDGSQIIYLEAMQFALIFGYYLSPGIKNKHQIISEAGTEWEAFGLETICSKDAFISKRLSDAGYNWPYVTK